MYWSLYVFMSNHLQISISEKIEFTSARSHCKYIFMAHYFPPSRSCYTMPWLIVRFVCITSLYCSYKNTSLYRAVFCFDSTLWLKGHSKAKKKSMSFLNAPSLSLAQHHWFSVTGSPTRWDLSVSFEEPSKQESPITKLENTVCLKLYAPSPLRRNTDLNLTMWSNTITKPNVLSTLKT